MAKQKVAKEPVLQSWDAVDETLKRVREIDQAVAKKTADTNAAKKKLDEALKAFTKDLLTEKKRLEKDLSEYSTAHKADLLPLKSRAFPHGVIKFNLSRKTATRPGQTWETTLDKLLEKLGDKIEKFRALCAKYYIRVSFAIDRESALGDYVAKKISKAKLIELGIEIEEEDEFGYDTADAEARSVA